ncbi:MAG TPA: adenylyltransferase/cytidyltransferase family protein [Bryobacteraceae bacterium]|nr:adenylyltransferase/cytidyltransferase family protein [Bryobacteraceae bacterium]
MKAGILAGAFNPVTNAHVALADAARRAVDEVICVVPRRYPHKEFHGAAIEQRIEMLRQAGCGRVEVVQGGLFIEIARELKPRLSATEIYFVCGRDAAERILNWDYGEPGAIARVLDEFQLLVAARQGEIHPPPDHSHRVHALRIGENLDHVSSSEVRRRIASGEPWEHLVPRPIVDLVREIYSTPNLSCRE